MSHSIDSTHKQLGPQQQQARVADLPQTVAPLTTSLVQRAQANPRALTPSDCLTLQTTIGNRALQRMLKKDATQPQLSSSLPISTMQSPGVLQRATGLPSRKEFELTAGKAGYHLGRGKSKFGQILSGLDTYGKLEETDLPGQLSQLTLLKTRIQGWMESKARSKGKRGDVNKNTQLKALSKTVDDLIVEKKEALIPRTDQDLSNIAQKSKYKNLRKVGGDRNLSSTKYEKEFVRSGDFAKGPVGNEVSQLNKNLKDFRKFKTEAMLARTESQVNLKAKQRDDAKKQVELNLDRLNTSNIGVQEQTDETYALDQSQFDNYKVEYLSMPEEREAYHLAIGGNMIMQGGKPFDTTKSYTWFSGSGTAIYVMDPNGEFFAGPHKIGRFHHSSFLGGGATAGAGEMIVKDGVLQEINNKSGHYVPGNAQMYQTLSELKERGIALQRVRLKLMGQNGYYVGGAARFIYDFEHNIIQ